MKSKLLLFLASAVIFLSSCGKDNTLQDCHNHDGGDVVVEEGYVVPTCVLEPYKSGIITTFTSQDAYENDGNGYAKTAPSSGRASSNVYKSVQFWLYVGNGAFVLSEAGVDNGNTPSTFHSLENACKKSDLTQIRLDQENYWQQNGFGPTSSYVVVTVKSFPVTIDGQVYNRMAGSTSAFDETIGTISPSHPQRLRLDPASYFDYEVIGYESVLGDQVFTW